MSRVVKSKIKVVKRDGAISVIANEKPYYAQHVRHRELKGKEYIRKFRVEDKEELYGKWKKLDALYNKVGGGICE